MTETKTVMVARAETPETVVVRTPPGCADIRVEVMSGLLVVLVRAGRTFLQTWVAALVGTAAGPWVPGVSDAFPPSEFTERLLAATFVALLAALVSAAQNGAELLGKVDAYYPELRA